MNNNRQRKSRCKGRNKQGKPCGAAATEGGLCFFHANPDKASELGRIGGRSKRQVITNGADPLPAVDSARAVRDTVARLIADVYSGQLKPRIAAGLAPLLHLQLRAITASDWEERLCKLEQVQAESNEVIRDIGAANLVNRESLQGPGGEHLE